MANQYVQFGKGGGRTTTPTTTIPNSGLRQAKSQTDRLEADLWLWRTKCRESGKKIPKRLVQGRAKWAFQRQGISDFKVIEFPKHKHTYFVVYYGAYYACFISPNCIGVFSQSLTRTWEFGLGNLLCNVQVLARKYSHPFMHFRHSRRIIYSNVRGGGKLQSNFPTERE
jgi:hypothetical protein